MDHPSGLDADLLDDPCLDVLVDVLVLGSDLDLPVEPFLPDLLEGVQYRAQGIGGDHALLVEHYVVGLGPVDVVLEHTQVLDHAGVETCRPFVEFLGQP